MANGAVITVDGVGRRFGDLVALDDVSFRVEPGHALALLGRNGAGKTTMLRILATVLVPTSGRATVAGFDVVAQGRQVRDHVGLLTVNERSLYWRLTGRQNLRFFDRVAGGPAATFGARVGDLVERLDLAGFVDHRVGSLSAGQRQRLVLARALLRRPAVLLLDEPLRGLDDVSTGLVLGVLRAELERGAALVLGAPQLHELADLAPDRLVLDTGRAVP